MAERRMFTKKITDSDAFTELTSAAQALYFHLNQGADDDGFNNQIQNAMFKAHATIGNLSELISKKFIIKFESGVVVIKHWRMHNTLRKDRYTPTNFKYEFNKLKIKENSSYTLDINTDDHKKQDESPPSTFSSMEDEQKNIFKYLQQAWGRTLSPYEYELLTNWTDDEITRYAIKESVKCNARSIKYVETIISNLKAKGIRTEAEAIKESDNFKLRKSRTETSVVRRTYTSSSDKLKDLERKILEEENK